MSLSWRERLDVFLSPSRVETLRRGGFLRQWKGEGASHPIQAAGTMREDWREPLARLAGLSTGEGLDMSILLSSCFVRFQVLPWMEEVQTAEERKSYAAIHFRQTYGAAADAWEIMVSEEPPGRPAPACAVDKALLEGLRALAVDKGCRLASVQPVFALAWNRWRGNLDGQGGFLAVAEEGALCMAASGSGGWLSMSNRRLAGTPLQEALSAVLDEQDLLADVPPPGARRCLAAVHGPAPSAVGWKALDGGWRAWL
ncbi:MAG: hypothetical protein PHU46_09055 [Rhodocyclaceae bacterium]|nr:hypothetical protein [Rhodocyclaceae bacterium]